MAETGDVGPLLDDVLSMVVEDVLDYDSLSSSTATTRRQRALHGARVSHPSTAHTTSRIAGDHRGRLSLRNTHPAAHGRRDLAPRAHHLRYNRFTRPQRHRRRLQDDSSITELLDNFSFKGGYDGTQIFFKLELDVSKGDVGGLRDVILKPLALLSETNFLQDLNIFSGGASSVDSVFDNTYIDISFSGGGHLGATGEHGLTVLVSFAT